MKKTHKIILLTVVIAAAAAGIYYIFSSSSMKSSPTVPEKKLVAIVNGNSITLDEFQEKYRRFTLRFNLPEGAEPEAANELKMSFLNKQIETELLKQEAEFRNLTVTDEELDREILQLKEDYPKDTLNEALERIGMQLEQWKEDRREKLLIDKLIQQEIDSIIHVSDQEVMDYYTKNKDEFKRPQMVRARQIVVATEEEAKSIRSRLLKGEDFAEMARLYSLSPDAEQGGDLGTFAKGQMPEEFDKIVFRYRVGSISKVVQSPYGFHIFKVEKRMPPRTLPLEDVQVEIRKSIFQARQETFFQEWLNSLKKQAQITIYPENLKDRT
jgi:peptidyl-prolyl cis-trans isomerase C